MTRAIILLWIFFILVLFVSIKYNLHKDGRYVQGIQLFVGLNVLLTTYIILVQVDNHAEEVKNENTNFYNLLVTYENGILEEFMKYPNMKYFFNELYNNEESFDQTPSTTSTEFPQKTSDVNSVFFQYHRDEYLEQIISYKIISFICFHAVYYFSHYNLPTFSELLSKQHNKIVKMVQMFMLSPIFVKYVKIYLNNYSDENFKQFLQVYNIYPDTHSGASRSRRRR